MATAIIGAALGTISFTTAAGTTAFLFGSGLWASVLTGAGLGMYLGSSSSFSTASDSPTYSFGEVSNTKTQKLPIPIILGGPVMVAGNIFYEKFKDDTCQEVDRYLGIGVGPIESISDVKASENLLSDIDGCSYRIYLNTDDDTADELDPEGDRPYPNGIAFLAMHLKAGEDISGSDTITSIVKGVQVWTPDGTQWTNNPAWLIYYLLTDSTNGLGISADVIDLDSFEAAAEYYGEEIDGEPRFAINYVIDTQESAVDVLCDLLGMCFSYITAREKIRLIPDAPVTTYYKAVDESNIVQGSFSWWQKDSEERYNRVIIEWCDPDNSYDQVVTIYEDEDDQAVHGVYEKSYSMLGCTSAAQANRSGARLIDAAQGVINYCEFQLSLKDADIESGDVIAVTHSLSGWDEKMFRVLTVTDEDTDSNSITVTCSEYVEETYNDRAFDVPTHIDTGVTVNRKPSSVTNINITEELSTADDGQVIDTAVITWENPSGFSSYIELWYRFEDDATYTAAANLPRAATEYRLDVTAHANDVIYIQIYTVSTLGVRSAATTYAHQLTGDTTPPALPTDITVTPTFKAINLSWTDPADADLDHINIFRATSEDGDFVKIGVAQRFDQEYTDSGLEVLTTYWYKLTAVDVARNESDYTEVVSGMTDAFSVVDIPEQSLDIAKLNSALQRAIDDIAKLAEAHLNTQLAVDSNRVTAADIVTTLTTTVEEGLHAEAESRTEMYAQIDDDIAVLQQIMDVAVHKVALTSSETEPDDPDEGDVWYTGTNYYRWNGSSWVEITEEDSKGTINAIMANASLLTDADGNIAGIGIKNSNISGSQISFLADCFYFASPVEGGDPIQLFTIDTSGDTPQLVMNGELFVTSAEGVGTGWITADMLNSKIGIQVADGGYIKMGEGTYIQMGDGGVLIDAEDAANPRILCRDTENTNGDYVEIKTGDVTTYKYINGAYRAQKSLVQVVTGVATNGTTTTIPGTFASSPVVLITPASLTTYNSSYGSSSQQLNIVNPTVSYNSSTGKATFTPEASLIIASGTGSMSVPSSVTENTYDKTVDTSSWEGTDFTLTTSSAGSISTTLAKITVSASIYGRCGAYEHITIGGESGMEEYYSLMTWTTTGTLYAVINGTSYSMGSKTWKCSDSPSTVTFTKTVTLNAALTSLTFKGNFSYYGMSGTTIYYTSQTSASAISTADYYCSVIPVSISYTTSSSTEIATGTVNYIAIA